METRTGVSLPVSAPRWALEPGVSGEAEVLDHGGVCFGRYVYCE